ncbi:MAG: hypothetical protein ACUVTW_13040 [Thermogutta sp.]
MERRWRYQAGPRPRSRRTRVEALLGGLALLLLLGGCHGAMKQGPAYDRPFPLGQVTDAHWETMQTNAEAGDFVFYDHEFVGQTAELTPLGRKHLLSAALRLRHVPFPVVVEELPNEKDPALDQARRATIVNLLAELGYPREEIEGRVITAPSFTAGLTAVEGEAAYYRTLNDTYGTGAGYGGYGRSFGGVRR